MGKVQFQNDEYELNKPVPTKIYYFDVLSFSTDIVEIDGNFSTKIYCNKYTYGKILKPIQRPVRQVRLRNLVRLQ